MKQGFWERGATDQKTKRTNGYLTVEVKGLVATSDGPGRYDAILWHQLRRQYSLNFLVPSIRPFKSPDICYIQQKTVLSTVFVVLVPKAGLEPARCCHQRILSPPRLPFHHFGKLLSIFYHIMFPLASVSAYLVRFYPIFLSPFRPLPLLQGKFRKLHLAIKI